MVVGVIPGGDPAFRNEFVVISAHLDHLGVGAPAANGDSIYNGADDNASGVAVLLAVARAIGRGNTAPRRSVLFVATSGEEVGMWGSDFFAGHPDTPLGEFVANINVDGVGRAAWPDSIAVLGGAWSTLGSAARDATLPSQSGLVPSFAPHAGFSRSDQYAFARRGVPSVHVYSGKLNAYYHTPADAFEVIDFLWLARVARYTHEFVTLVANGPRKPVWTDPYHAAGRVPW
jgi:Zn-dependent M28 family amino/carboxypeptidase